MSVFKVFFKIIKYNWASLAIYLFIYIGLVTIGGAGSGEQAVVDFEMNKTNMVIFNEGEESPLVEAFRTYLAAYTNQVQLPDEEEALQDALHFGKIDYILRIPEGFVADVLAGTPQVIEKTLVPQSAQAMFTDTFVESYWQRVAQYSEHMPGLTEETYALYVRESFKESSEVVVRQSPTPKQRGVLFTMNYIGYILVTMMILIVGMGIERFYSEDVYRRSCCGAKSKTTLYLQLFWAHVCVALLAYGMLISIVGVKYQYSFVSEKGLLYLLNGGVFLSVALSIGFLIGRVVRRRHVQNMVANVVGLGLSFVSGVFVTRSYLPEEVLEVAKFAPMYWYVDANEQIDALTVMGGEQVVVIMQSIGVQVGFMVAILSVGLVVNKYYGRVERRGE